MSVRAAEITIAVTVYSRRKYVRQAIQSALNQTVPVKVIVVEDSGPDPTLQAYISDSFGDRIEYFRNPSRRGLFGNWNACIDYCKTPWLSILHDDDVLEPHFVESMQRLSEKFENRSLYFGRTRFIDSDGKILSETQNIQQSARGLTIGDFVWGGIFPFPGQLFNVSDAKSVGYFRETSMYCGDWEMWAKLSSHSGSAQTSEVVARFREHGGIDRGSNKVARVGRAEGLIRVQRKRVLASMDRLRVPYPDELRKQLYHAPVSTRFLLDFSKTFSARFEHYHRGLVIRANPPHFRYKFVQLLVKMLGPHSLRHMSKIWCGVWRLAARRRG